MLVARLSSQWPLVHMARQNHMQSAMAGRHHSKYTPTTTTTAFVRRGLAVAVAVSNPTGTLLWLPYRTFVYLPSNHHSQVEKCIVWWCWACADGGTRKKKRISQARSSTRNTSVAMDGCLSPYTHICRRGGCSRGRHAGMAWPSTI